MTTSRDRPNVVVFCTDQQRWDTVGAYGCPMDVTPNLDRLAETGTLVERAYSPQPLCTPARACIQTGLHATEHGAWRNGRTPTTPTTLAREFASAGYETAYVGKFHLADTGTDPVPGERRMGYEDYWRASDNLEHTSHPYEGVVYDGDGESVKFTGYRVDELTEMAVDFVRRDHDASFLLFLSTPEPHHDNDLERFVAPERYARRYRNPHVPPDLRGTRGDWYESLPNYYGACKRIDECLGRLIDALEAEEKREETVVAFLSDHGCHFRTRNWEYKRSCHDASARVPAVFAGPGFDTDASFDGLFSLVDVAPTLLDAAGLPVPERMQGQSLLATRRGEVDPRSELLIQVSNSELGRAIRTDRWKYSVIAPDADPNAEPAADEYVERYLYDLDADPAERENLIGKREYQAVASQLRRRLLQRIESIEDEEPAIEPFVLER
jgi:arylsulfatase A-like enzyme